MFRVDNHMVKEKYLVYFKIFIVVLLLVYYGFFLARKIDLTTADLGRHLKNGELILTSIKDFCFTNPVLHINFYSYTFPGYPFINHHWGTGVIFFIIQKLFGLTGLSLFYLFLSLLTFFLFFRLAQKMAGFKISALISLLLIPLIAERREIRPEIFTYFFSALFFYLIWRQKQLFVLPVLMIFWVNIHIYFFIGLILVSLFLLESFFKKNREKTKQLGIILLLSSVASFINPFGLKGVLYPLNIFREYGYLVVENQSVWFLDRWGFNNPNLLLFKIIFIVLFLSFVLLIIFNRKNFSVIYFCLAMGLGVMAWLAIRNFTIFGFFALPIIAYNIKYISLARYFPTKLRTIYENKKNSIFIILLLVIIVSLFFNQRLNLDLYRSISGLGLMPNNNAAAEFFKKQNISGPIFNNYDIGGYLIYHLYPKYQIFVDNRPEAYPTDFFQKIYIPAQDDEKKWQQVDEKYKFNVIFFSHRDLTPWAQKFLINRINDSSWAPVFADQYAIIFLKRNSINEPIITKYEIPKEQFRIINLK